MSGSGCCAALAACLRRVCGGVGAADDDPELGGGVTPRGEGAPNAAPPVVSPRRDACLSALLPQLIGAWYAAWRLASYAPPSSLGLEVAHCALLYVALLLVVTLRRGAQSGLPDPRLPDMTAR